MKAATSLYIVINLKFDEVTSCVPCSIHVSACQTYMLQRPMWCWALWVMCSMGTCNHTGHSVVSMGTSDCCECAQRATKAGGSFEEMFTRYCVPFPSLQQGWLRSPPARNLVAFSKPPRLGRTALQDLSGYFRVRHECRLSTPRVPTEYTQCPLSICIVTI